MSRLTALALYRMLYETCGEDPEMLNKAKVMPIFDSEVWDSDCVYHITYKEKDPFDGIDLKVRISFIREEREVEGITRYRDIAVYTITDSVYGDDGTFEIVL